MTATYSIIWNATLSSAAASVAVGDVLIEEESGGALTGQYVKATTANRGTRRSAGIARTAGDSTNLAVEMQIDGRIPAAVTGLGAGAVSWVRVSTLGVLERCTPSSGDDLVGKCDAYGTLALAPGVWDSTNYAGASGSTPTGTGFVHITSGSQDAASTAVNLASAHVTGVLPKANQAAQDMAGDVTGTTAAAVVAKVNGIACSGTPAAGAVLRATSASAAAWGQLDLADTDAVTGILPKTNQQAQDMSGDVSGSTSASIVAKVNGITCSGTPAAGAVLRATSASAASWGQLDLADTDAVTGVLPTGNVATTLTGKTLTTATIDADQNTITNIANANIKAGAAIAISKLATIAASDIASGTLAMARGGLAADVSAYSGFVKITLGASSAVSIGSGVDTWISTPSGANLASALTSALPDTKGGTGLTSLGSGVATFLGTPSGANLASALTSALPDTKGGTGLTSLGSGVATWLGTPSGANLASALTTALPDTKGGTGLTALGSGVATFLGTPSGANLASALTTALPATKGGTGLTSLGTGVATWLGTPTAANLITVLGLGVTGSGSAVFDTSPTISGLTLSNTPTLSGNSTSTSNNAKGTEVNVNPVNVQTTDATVTTLDSFTIASNSAVVVSWLVTAIKSDSSQAAAYSVTACFKNAAGTAAQVGSTTTTTIAESDSAWDATADNSTTTIRLRVTGKAATTIQWTAVLTRLTVIP